MSSLFPGSFTPSLQSSFFNSPEDQFRVLMESIHEMRFSMLNKSYDNSFRAVCLSGIKTSSNSGTSLNRFDANLDSESRINITIMPVTKLNGNIPTFEGLTKPEEVLRLIDLYSSVFRGKSDFKSKMNNAPQFGQIVDCYLVKGSIVKSNFGDIRFKAPRNLEIDKEIMSLSSIEGIESIPRIFSNGMVGLLGAYPNNGFPDDSEIMIQGSVYPHDPIRSDKKIRLRKEMINEYIPARDRALSNEPLGLRLLATSMAIKEGFYKDTRAYRHNNPGNIGNTDSGANVQYPTLEAGIKRQASYIKSVAAGRHRAYPLGKKKIIKPYYSDEIARNQKSYGGKSPYLPGYEFTYTGQIDQFVKIYATGARSGNSYLSTIISYFKENGISINNESKIQDIIRLNK